MYTFVLQAFYRKILPFSLIALSLCVLQSQSVPNVPISYRCEHIWHTIHSAYGLFILDEAEPFWWNGKRQMKITRLCACVRSIYYKNSMASRLLLSPVCMRSFVFICVLMAYLLEEVQRCVKENERRITIMSLYLTATLIHPWMQTRLWMRYTFIRPAISRRIAILWIANNHCSPFSWMSEYFNVDKVYTQICKRPWQHKQKEKRIASKTETMSGIWMLGWKIRHPICSGMCRRNTCESCIC